MQKFSDTKLSYQKYFNTNETFVKWHIMYTGSIILVVLLVTRSRTKMFPQDWNKHRNERPKTSPIVNHRHLRVCLVICEILFTFIASTNCGTIFILIYCFYQFCYLLCEAQEQIKENKPSKLVVYCLNISTFLASWTLTQIVPNQQWDTSGKRK